MTLLVEAIILPLVMLLATGPVITRLFRARRAEEPTTDACPTVTVVTPMFNEGEGIRRTIRSILAQSYPADRLDMILVDDCSTDDSYAHALEESLEQPRVRVLRNEINQGKRLSINRAIAETNAEFVVSVDSDVELDADAVKNLLRRFTSPKIAAVGGWVDIRNKGQSWLTRMQTAKYYFGYHLLKSLERTFRSVMCLSGCLTAYRRDVLIQLAPVLERRNLLGMPIKYGEDRFLTRQIVKAGYETTMTTDAICRTDAPSTLRGYIDQQLRWRRSNVVDYFGGLSHVWRIHPIVAVHYYSLFLMFLAYPVLLFYALGAGLLFPLMVAHLAGMACLGVLYRVLTRHLPDDQRVSAAAILPMALVMPVTYGILTPLALLTLDSRKWETRGHEEPMTADDAEPTPEPTPLPVSVPVPVKTSQVLLDSIHVSGPVP